MFLPKPTESASFETAPAGTFTAICYRFIDRGTQKSTFESDTRIRREVMLTWELCGELMTDGRPFSVSKIYTWSMHEKAALRKDLESWRGLAFSDRDFDGPGAFNTKKLLGAPCTITVSHKVKPDGTTYANVTGIGKAMKGIQIPPCVNPHAYLALTKGDFDPNALAALSDKMKATIAASPEYFELMNGVSGNVESDDDGPRPFAPVDDDIPF